MKRFALLFALLLICLTLPALAWEVSPKHEALAAQHLPGYAVLDGCSDEELTVLLVTGPDGENRLAFYGNRAVTLSEPLPEHLFRIYDALIYDDVATLLMEDYEGAVYFVGCLWNGDMWTLQVSQALPEGVCFDNYQYGEDWVIFCFPHPEGVPSLGFEDEVAWVEFVAYLQEDGRWLVRNIYNDNEASFAINREGVPGLCINCTGTAYGTVTLEQDVRYIDWSAYPMCLEDALAYLADDMGVIGADVLPLYTDTACTDVIAGYLYATPVTVLDREGGMVQVRIADSNIIGWLDVEGLLLGAAQIFLHEEGWLTTAGYEMEANYVELSAGAVMYATPEGSAACTTEWDGWYILMSASVDGWYHICDPETLESGWVRAADGVPVE